MTHPRQPRETDDSTMFSLHELVRHQPEEPSPSEDSGLIDLATLRSVAASDPIAEAHASGLFGASSAPRAPQPPSTRPPPVPRRDRYVAAGLWAAVVLLSAAIAGKLYPSTPPAANAPAVTVNEPAPAPAAPDSPGPDLEAAEPVAADGTPDDPSTTEPAAAERATPVVQRKSPPTATKTESVASPVATPPKPPKVPSPGCICPPDDLTCHMRCATAG